MGNFNSSLSLFLWLGWVSWAGTLAAQSISTLPEPTESRIPERQAQGTTGQFSPPIHDSGIPYIPPNAQVEPGVADWDLQTQHYPTVQKSTDRIGVPFSTPYRMGGWIEQGMTFNPDRPVNRQNVPVLFNDRANDYQLNQAYLFLARDVCTDDVGWDLGGRLDVTFGTDSRFVTVPGLERHHDRTRKWNSENRLYGLAVPQAYVELGTPIGPYGSSVRLGHFYSLGGYETFAAPDNFFYSHAYTYLYGEPFTFTGLMWSGKLSETLAAAFAVTGGWDTWDSHANEWGFRAAVMKKLNGGRTSVTFAGHSGHDFTGVTTAAGIQSEPRHWGSVVLKHEFSPCMYYVIQSDYGYQDNAVLLLDQTSTTLGFRSAHWWGINQHVIYQFHDALAAGLRVEWFRDQNHARVGIPVEFDPAGPTFNGQDYFAITAGLNIKPHSNVVFRPELRWDWSNVESNPNVPGGQAGIRPFNDRGDSSQFTLSMDVIVHY